MKTLMLKYPSLGQMFRYGIVGVLNNLLGYLLYLIITFIWLEPTVAISLFYPIGALTAYIGHSKYSFSAKTMDWNTSFRFILAYAFGYGINFTMLRLFSEKWGYPHQAVQAVAIFIVAGFLFFVLKFFVFRQRP